MHLLFQISLPRQPTMDKTDFYNNILNPYPILDYQLSKTNIIYNILFYIHHILIIKQNLNLIELLILKIVRSNREKRNDNKIRIKG